MARSRSRSGGQRDAFAIANPVVADPLRRTVFTALSLLQELEDRRQWHPEAIAPARAFVRSASRLIARPQPSRVRGRRIKLFSPSMVAFADPARVAVCVRRRVRREVLHARRVAGSSTMRKKRRFNPYSRIHC